MMSFGTALQVLREGHRVRRKGWTVDTFLYLVPGSTFEVDRPPLLGIFKKGTIVTYEEHIDCCSGPNLECSVWGPSLQDSLANDWVTV